MIKKKYFYFLIIFLLCFSITLFFYLSINQKNTAFDEKEIDFYIPNNFSFDEVVNSLRPFLISSKTFIFVSNLKGYSSRIKHGKYKIKKGSSNNQIINILRSKSLPIKLTFNNQETLEDLAGRISIQIESDSLSLIKTFRDTVFLKKMTLILKMQFPCISQILINFIGILPQANFEIKCFLNIKSFGIKLE